MGINSEGDEDGQLLNKQEELIEFNYHIIQVATLSLMLSIFLLYMRSLILESMEEDITESELEDEGADEIIDKVIFVSICVQLLKLKVCVQEKLLEIIPKLKKVVVKEEMKVMKNNLYDIMWCKCMYCSSVQ